jgi:hypothetical protein
MVIIVSALAVRRGRRVLGNQPGCRDGVATPSGPPISALGGSYSVL